MLRIARAHRGTPLHLAAKRLASEVYLDRLESQSSADTDAAAVLLDGDEPVATAGIFLSRTHRPLFFERFLEGGLESIVGPFGRDAVAELGARAIKPNHGLEKRSLEISGALIIVAAAMAAEEGVEHIVFIGDRLLSRFSRLFDLQFTNLGRASIDRIESEHRANFERYFSVGRSLYSVPASPAQDLLLRTLPRLAESIGITLDPEPLSATVAS